MYNLGVVWSQLFETVKFVTSTAVQMLTVWSTHCRHQRSVAPLRYLIDVFNLTIAYFSMATILITTSATDFYQYGQIII